MTTEVESPATGILAKILIEAGVEVPVLTIVGLITEPGEEIPTDFETSTVTGAAAQEAAAAQPQQAPSAPVQTPAAAVAVQDTGRLAIMPSARKLALEMGLDFASIEPTGPDGVILLCDVEAAATAPATRASTVAGSSSPHAASSSRPGRHPLTRPSA